MSAPSSVHRSPGVVPAPSAPSKAPGWRSRAIAWLRQTFSDGSVDKSGSVASSAIAAAARPETPVATMTMTEFLYEPVITMSVSKFLGEEAPNESSLVHPAASPSFDKELIERYLQGSPTTDVSSGPISGGGGGGGGVTVDEDEEYSYSVSDAARKFLQDFYANLGTDPSAVPSASAAAASEPASEKPPPAAMPVRKPVPWKFTFSAWDCRTLGLSYNPNANPFALQADVRISEGGVKVIGPSRWGTCKTEDPWKAASEDADAAPILKMPPKPVQEHDE